MPSKKLELGNRNIALDLKREADGAWIKSEWDGVEFCIASGLGDKFVLERRRRFRALSSQLGFEIREEDFSRDEVKQAEAELYADLLLKGWRGLVNAATGEPVPFNKENAVAILMDDRYRMVKAFIYAEATRPSNFFADLREQAAKN